MCYVCVLGNNFILRCELRCGLGGVCGPLNPHIKTMANMTCEGKFSLTCPVHVSNMLHSEEQQGLVSEVT